MRRVALVLLIVVAVVWLGALLWDPARSSTELAEPVVLVDEAPASVLVPARVDPISAPVEVLASETPSHAGVPREAAPDEVVPDPSGVGVLRVFVVDGRGAPVPGVVVHADGVAGAPGRSRLATSAADGSARLQDVPVGRCLASTDRGGLALGQVAAGEVTEVVLELPDGVSVGGRVVDRSGVPVGGASVWLLVPSRPRSGSEVAQSQPDGRFQLDFVPAGSQLCARHPDLAPSARFDVAASPDAALEVELVLGDGAASLKGHVVDDEGRPIRGARVVATAWTQEPFALSGPPATHGTSDERGRFLLVGLAPGPTRVGVQAASHAPRNVGPLHLQTSAREEFEVELQPGCTLAGVARSASRDALPDVDVAVDIGDLAVDPLAQQALSDGAGRFRIGSLPSGVFPAVARHPDGRRVSSSLVFAPDAPTSWEPVFSGSRRIHGTLVDPAWNPLPGWLVTFAASDQPARPLGAAVSDERGAFAFTLAEQVEQVQPDEHASFVLAVRDVDSPQIARAVQTGVAPREEAYVLVFDPLTPSGAAVDGTLVDAAGMPLQGLTAELVGAVGAAPVELATDGGFRSEPLPPGDYLLSFDDGDGVVFARSVRVEQADVHLGLLSVPATGVLRLSAEQPTPVQIVGPAGLVARRVIVTGELDVVLPAGSYALEIPVSGSRDVRAAGSVTVMASSITSHGLRD